MGNGILSAFDDSFLASAERLRATHPGNLCAKHLTRELITRLDAGQRQRLYHCCRSGIEHPESEVGCYLLHPDDLITLRAFFEPLFREYHDADFADESGRSDGWDLASLGLPPVSVRMRVARSVTGFNLPAKMSLAERVDFERAVSAALQPLIDDPDYGGRIYRPTSEPVDAHVMKDISADPHMRSAGIADDWPHGRACYVSRNKEAIVWIGEEDHLRIICMRTVTGLGEVLDRLRALVDRIEALPGMRFVRDATFGYVNSCPSNLGTGMRASVRLGMPAPQDLSPPRRGFMSEAQILDKLYDGARKFAATLLERPVDRVAGTSDSRDGLTIAAS